jgi:hypothetical protein
MSDCIWCSDVLIISNLSIYLFRAKNQNLYLTKVLEILLVRGPPVSLSVGCLPPLIGRVSDAACHMAPGACLKPSRHPDHASRCRSGHHSDQPPSPVPSCLAIHVDWATDQPTDAHCASRCFPHWASPLLRGVLCLHTMHNCLGQTAPPHQSPPLRRAASHPYDTPSVTVVATVLEP